jgi:small subunit ribosomal protein S11
MEHALNAMEQLQRSTSKLALDAVARARNVYPTPDNLMDTIGSDAKSTGQESDQPYHFHVYAHKHNCHITVTKPNRDAIISVSCGNLGFKKSQRKHYDSAYQLGAYVVDKLHQGGWHKKIKQMEVVLRGFGQGREAVTKVLLGTQGKMLRNSIIRVADSTRLKFGGTRSPKPRRLG